MQISSFSQPSHVFSEDHPSPFVADSEKKKRKKKTSAPRASETAYVPTSCSRDQRGPSPAEDEGDDGSVPASTCEAGLVGGDVVGLVSNRGGGSVVRISLLLVLLVCLARTGGKVAMWSKMGRETTKPSQKANPSSITQRLCSQSTQIYPPVAAGKQMAASQRCIS